MTLNLILFTISIKKRDYTIEEELHFQKVERHMEAQKTSQSAYLPKF
ncbi:YrzI family small protein [Mesobacillus maritimus]|nr:YrzI family small protein [Mesobacillus maritimus]MCM3585832.1 YrzI family small protein [Mesobacillus maritimus]MCM3670592.1 YrzI family small protein [Mesobacillus maritimus]